MPCGKIFKQAAAHGDGSCGKGSGAYKLPAVRPGFEVPRLAVPARRNFQTADRRNRRKRFAAEAERRQALKVAVGNDFACCMGKGAQLDVVFCHTAAVIGNADKACAARFYFGGNARSARIHRIVQKLAQNRAGAVDNLSGGYFTRNLRHKRFNGTELCIVFTHRMRSRLLFVVQRTE